MIRQAFPDVISPLDRVYFFAAAPLLETLYHLIVCPAGALLRHKARERERERERAREGEREGGGGSHEELGLKHGRVNSASH